MLNSQKEWRLFFATDIHGSTVCFKKFLNARNHYNARVLIMGGDITGKMLVPIVRNGRNHTFTATFMGDRQEFASVHDAEKFGHWVEDRGGYPYVCETDELDQLRTQPEYRDRVFGKLICQRVGQWVELADKRLKGEGTIVLVNAGNDDIYMIDTILDQSESLVRPEGKILELVDGVVVASCGYSNLTPWKCPRDVSEPELKNALESLLRKVKVPSQCIVNFHCPPRGTCLDQAPSLDRELRPRLTGLGVEMESVGSLAVREVVESFQPLLGLHGHVHESRGIARLGDTMCINPGSEYQEGILNGMIADFKDGHLRSDPVLTSG